MSNMFRNELQHEKPAVWTPWGPQAIKSANPKLESLRRSLKKLGKIDSASKAGALEDDYRDRPECSYDP